MPKDVSLSKVWWLQLFQLYIHISRSLSIYISSSLSLFFLSSFFLSLSLSLPLCFSRRNLHLLINLSPFFLLRFLFLSLSSFLFVCIWGMKVTPLLFRRTRVLITHNYISPPGSNLKTCPGSSPAFCQPITGLGSFLDQSECSIFGKPTNEIQVS